MDIGEDEDADEKEACDGDEEEEAKEGKREGKAGESSEDGAPALSWHLPAASWCKLKGLDGKPPLGIAATLD